MLTASDLAAKVCMVNTAPTWLTEFKNFDDTTVMPSVPATDYSSGEIWYAMYKGNIIEGITMCNASSTNPTIQDYGPNCWCRMIRPVMGASWVFRYTSDLQNNCYSHCSLSCARCVRDGTNALCTRAALLAH